MDSRMQTGLLLVLGVISLAAGWMGVYPADPTDSIADQTKSLMADSGLATVGILMGFGGMIAVFIGLVNISRKMLMAGGPGSAYANITALISMAIIAVMIMGLGTELAVANGSSAGTGAIMLGLSNAVGQGAGIPMGIALVLLGVAIYREKNFHMVAAALAVVSGILLVSSVPNLIVETGSDASDLLQLAGWVGFMLNGLVLGVLRLRAAD
jgi:hypothetical protein